MNTLTHHHETIIDALAEALVREYLTPPPACELDARSPQVERAPLAAVDKAA